MSVDTKAGDRHSMLHAMKLMRDSLAGIVAEVRSGTETIATASTQIATGNLDLSSRTEEQASTLEETASSIEELTATVAQNAETQSYTNQGQVTRVVGRRNYAITFASGQSSMTPMRVVRGSSGLTHRSNGWPVITMRWVAPASR